MKTAIAEPKTASKKPSIVFTPKLRQYESGIDYVQADGYRVKITLKGYTPPTMEDERRILRLMERDPMCGITTWENREMPQEQKEVESENRQLRAENTYQAQEMAALREENRRLRESAKAKG